MLGRFRRRCLEPDALGGETPERTTINSARNAYRGDNCLDHFVLTAVGENHTVA
jgi:hypothetical protein